MIKELEEQIKKKKIVMWPMIWSSSVQFGLVQSISVKFSSFGVLQSIRSNTVHFGPVLPNSVHFGRFCPFQFTYLKMENKSLG